MFPKFMSFPEPQCVTLCEKALKRRGSPRSMDHSSPGLMMFRALQETNMGDLREKSGEQGCSAGIKPQGAQRVRVHSRQHPCQELVLRAEPAVAVTPQAARPPFPSPTDFSKFVSQDVHLGKLSNLPPEARRCSDDRVQRCSSLLSTCSLCKAPGPNCQTEGKNGGPGEMTPQVGFTSPAT